MFELIFCFLVGNILGKIHFNSTILLGKIHFNSTVFFSAVFAVEEYYFFKKMFDCLQLSCSINLQYYSAARTERQNIMKQKNLIVYNREHYSRYTTGPLMINFAPILQRVFLF